ncbi:hypothetical protein AK812_SmicGene10137 [Symbiodinium microadriaticum]|uniref:Uncharacterized protein n=1 Tax=Symbiodinium microadriaticum TaxID=2951 RepID=A0A1Q9EGM4_SYMMI|nr:hypothetical protein AK812_SmicGene10137 [Symbiodinium microadriaticum]
MEEELPPDDIKGYLVQDYYDNFLSHDWKTSGLLKYLSLLILFNAKAAAIASVLISVLVGTLRMMTVLPNLVWTELLCFAFFYVVLVFWQNLLAWLRLPRMVFLDKLCIPQDDEEKKAQCIRGLACYLDCARTLTVLWSDRYFSRLWCVFEMASFLRHRSKPSIQFLPVELSLLVSLGGVSYSVMHLIHGLHNELVNVQNQDDEGPTEGLRQLAGLSGLLMTVFYITVACFNYLGLQLMNKFRLLPKQLHRFDARKAECFCCSVGHVDPCTGAPIPCDRKLIMTKIERWYDVSRNADATDVGPDSCITEFNNLVRKELADTFLAMTASANPVFWKYIYFIVGMNTPIAARALGNMSAELLPSSLEGNALLAWRVRWVGRLFHNMLQIVGSVEILMIAWGVGAVWLRDRNLAVASLMLSAPITIIAFAILFVPFRLFWLLTADDSLLILAPVLLELFFVVACSRARGLLSTSISQTAAESMHQLSIRSGDSVHSENLKQKSIDDDTESVGDFFSI